jgi:hypothetical protein
MRQSERGRTGETTRAAAAANRSGAGAPAPADYSNESG